MPVAFRLYLPETWVKDKYRRKKTGVPKEIQFQTKTNIALEQIQRARKRGIPQGVVLADAGYGNNTSFRMALTAMEVPYVMGVQNTVTVWKPSEERLPAPPRKATQAVLANSCSATRSTIRFPPKNWPPHYRPKRGTR